MSRPDGGGEDAAGFLGRWARRKSQTQQVAAEAPVAPKQPVEAAPEAADDAQLPLPSLDSIAPGGDVAAFFQKHVPEALRTAALRKLWVTDPAIRDFIEMADYQWDFNNPDSIPGWSSSVEGYDVKAMIEQVFGGGRAAESRAPEPLAADRVEPIQSIEAPPSAQTLPEPAASAEKDDKTTPCEPSEEAPADQDPDHVAAQDYTKESEVYEPVRNRHGGALPT